MAEQNLCIDFLREIGSVEDLKSDMSRGLRADCDVLFNSHVHFPPNFSAFETVEQAMDLAAEQNIKVLGTGNYYNYAVYEQFSLKAQQRGIFPLFGTEVISLERDIMEKGLRFNDPGNPGKLYICGKAITGFVDMQPKARELLSIMCANDSARIAEMIKKMASVFKAGGLDTGLTQELVIRRIAERHQCDPKTIVLQERHVAQVFQQVICELLEKDPNPGMLRTIFGADSVSALDDAVGLQNEIRTYLMKSGKPCFVSEDFFDFKQSCELINTLGGIVCYPVLADGADPRCEYEADPDQLLASLKESNIYMAEFIPLRNKTSVLNDYVTTLRKGGIAVVAGTEHNTLDLVPLDPACKGGEPLSKEIREIFWEGTCVIAAHQFLTAHGRRGFTDHTGNANKDYADNEQRIAEFAALGSAVLARYFKTK